MNIQPDPYDTPEYEAFVESMAKHCHCSPPWQRPCDGVLAGGVCDDMGNGPTLDDDTKCEDHDEDHES